MKKILTLVAALSLVASLAIGGSIAYLQDTDEAVNVMTVGSVYIEQHEYERVIDENGDFVSTGEVDEYTYTPDKLQAYTDGKMILPAVYEGESAPWSERKGTDGSAHRQSWAQIGAPGNNQISDAPNVIDKFVFVENTGNTDAYYRTLVAIEYPAAIPDGMIHIVDTSHNYFTKNSGGVFAIEINGIRYTVHEYLYNQILAPGEISRPSFLQVYLDKTAGNDEVNLFGNSFDIMVISQAVQASGFSNAETALNAAFKEVNAENAVEWFKGIDIPTYVTTAAQLEDALLAGGNVVLGANVTADGEASIEIPEGVTATLNLAGHNITNPVVGAPALVNNGTLTITGDGAVANGVNSTKASHTVVNNGTLTINGGNIGTDDTAGAAVVNYGTTTINGGTFASKQENVKADGLCAYAFINQSGTMTINNATLNGQTHGLFGAYGGEIVVNGGSYTMDGNGGLGCYVVYSNGTGVVELNGGTINTNNPRSNRVFFVYKNGNYFNEDAVETGCVVVNGAKIYLNGVEQTYAAPTVEPDTAWGETENEGVYEVANAAQLYAFAKAVNEEGNSFSGKTVRLTADIDLKNQDWKPIGLNADDAKKFKGTFDGQGHTISNLNVNTEDGYTAAGLFGALNGTVKNLTINGATVKHISTGAATDNGIAVVAGSIYTSGSIDGVTVKNAKVEGNRYVGGISGYTYGTVTNCTVDDIELIATPDNATGSYDNGDKVGGIAGYFAAESVYNISNNTVKNATLKAYRDVGGVVGCANEANYVTNNSVNDVSITVDQVTNNYGNKDANAGEIVGRITKGTLGSNNQSSSVTINQKQ